MDAHAHTHIRMEVISGKQVCTRLQPVFTWFKNEFIRLLLDRITAMNRLSHGYNEIYPIKSLYDSFIIDMLL